MASAAEELDVDGVAVRLTSPDKVYFPQLGSKGTKRTMVDYYLAVADRMVTLLRDRPTHLQRFPDGIEGEEIYQKRVPVKHPEYLKTCTVTFPSGRTADALKVTHPSAIIWAAQMGTITLHPWQVRCPDVDHPDELRIDLDPQPGTGFKEAREIATGVLKPILDELGMTGYPKTSGGRGVHVFVRIKPEWDFIAVRRAGIALAREVERRAPDAVTTSWWKEERGERLFIDYNQNARDRTFASAYSVRKTQTPTPTTTPWQRCRICLRGATIRGPASMTSRIPWIRCWRWCRPMRTGGWGICRTRPTTPRCRGSRSGCSRARTGISRNTRTGLSPLR
jgi:DNA ligase D-like protein (predicted polymerase)